MVLALSRHHQKAVSIPHPSTAPNHKAQLKTTRGPPVVERSWDYWLLAMRENAQPWELSGISVAKWRAFLVAQMVKNPLAMQETRVRSLHWEDSLEEGMATHSSILAWRIPMDRGAWWATVHGVTKNQTQLGD